jgi:hypothetical protein
VVNSQLSKLAGLTLPTSLLHTARTIRLVAAEIRAAKAGPASAVPAAGACTSRVWPDATRPLSGSQEQMWALDRASGPSAAYHVPVAFLIRGTVDAAALRAALDVVVARHEVLRSTYSVLPHSGELRTTVLPPARFCVPLEQLEQGVGGLAAAVADAALAPFDLDSGPLLRVALLTGDVPDSSVLCITMHHSVRCAQRLPLAAGRRSGQPGGLPPGRAGLALWIHHPATLPA